MTGCTGGLGQGFAETLARRGFNLLLISRSATKLDALAKELRSAHSIEARFLAFDFLHSVTGSADERKFFDQTLPKMLDELDNDVALLVNNVGVGNENPHLAPEVRARGPSPSPVMSVRAASSPQVDLEEEAAMVRVNCGAAVRMCRVLLPRFAARRSGAILNISSGSCNQPSPCVARAISLARAFVPQSAARLLRLSRSYLAVYSATKAFLAQYSQCIAREYAAMGLLISCVTPYYISGTGLYANAKASVNAPPVRTIVSGALKTVSSASATERELAFGYNVHALMGFIFGSVPFAAPSSRRASCDPRARASPAVAPVPSSRIR